MSGQTRGGHSMLEAVIVLEDDGLLPL